MSKISIIIPVYYNADTLMLLYEDMKEKILGTLGDYEIVMVDDGSEDDSWKVMNQIRDIDENVKLVKLSRNFGEHAAILAGLSNCTGDCAVTKQADLQEDSELIVQMYEKWKEGNKVVLAVRRERDEPAVKKFFANLYYSIVRKTIDSKMPKGGCDCYLIDRQAIEVLLRLDERNSSLTLQVLWIGFKSDNVYFHRKDREVGESKWTLSKKVKLYHGYSCICMDHRGDSGILCCWHPCKRMVHTYDPCAVFSRHDPHHARSARRISVEDS